MIHSLCHYLFIILSSQCSPLIYTNYQLIYYKRMIFSSSHVFPSLLIVLAHLESYCNALRMIRHARWFEEETAHLIRYISIVIIYYHNI